MLVDRSRFTRAAAPFWVGTLTIASGCAVPADGASLDDVSAGSKGDDVEDVAAGERDEDFGGAGVPGGASAPVEICRVDGGFIDWACEPVDSTEDLCEGYDGNYSVNGNHRFMVRGRTGATCLFNGTVHCSHVYVSQDGTHFECHYGSQTTWIGFDGVPLSTQRQAGSDAEHLPLRSIDPCDDLGDGEVVEGYVKNRLFSLRGHGPHGFICDVGGEAVVIPTDSDNACDKLHITAEGFVCDRAARGEELWPYRD